MATSDADKKYKDQGSSFGESFAPIVALLKSAYGAWMDADQVYNDADDAVLGKLEEAALLIADAGFTAADFLGEVIDNAIMDFGMSDSDKELTNKVLGWVKGGGGKVLSPLIDAGHEVVDFIKPLGTLDSALINKIDRPLKKWIAGEIEELGNLFKKGSPKLDIGRTPGRVEHQKKLLDTILLYLPRNKKEARALRDEANAPRFGGDRLNWDQNRYIYPIADPGSSDAKNMVLDWVQSLDDDELEEFTSKETYDELEAWIDAAPGEGATINDQMVWISGLEFGYEGGTAQSLIRSLATDDPEVFDGPSSKRFEKVLEGDFLPTENSPENRAARATGAADIEAGERDRFVPGVSDVSPTSPVPDDSFADNYPEFRKNQADETLATLQERTLAADLARTNRAPETTIDPNYGKDPDKDGLGDTGGGDNGGKGSELTDEAMKYINENFGSVEFFQNFHGDKMWIDTDGDGTLDTNVIQKIIDDKEENPDVIWGLFQKTQWFQENGPTARQFQVDWSKAGGTNDWSPSFNADAGIGMQWNMNAGMHEMLGDTYDSLILEANRLGINTDDPVKKNAIMQMAYNAKQLNMTDFEIKSEFANGFQGAFDINKVQGSGTFLNIKQQLRQNAATYMMKLDEATLNDYTQKIYLGKATYEGITAGHAQSVMDQEPALKSLIEQGYTPSAYFSSYSNTASELLGRPIDFLGGDSKLYSHLKDTMVANDGLNRPMTRGEFQRYVRSTPEWDTSENARDEAYGTVGTLLNSFGIKV